MLVSCVRLSDCSSCLVELECTHKDSLLRCDRFLSEDSLLLPSFVIESQVTTAAASACCALGAILLFLGAGAGAGHGAGAGEATGARSSSKGITTDRKGNRTRKRRWEQKYRGPKRQEGRHQWPKMMETKASTDRVPPSWYSHRTISRVFSLPVTRSTGRLHEGGVQDL